ncbi:response regulator [bacterium]|nr:response regulator [bacterium]
MKEKKEYIAIIEDDVKIQDLITLTLANFPQEIMTFSTGKEGLDFIKKNRERVRLLLLDIKLPQMSGFDILKDIRKRMQLSIPVVIISAYVSKYDIERGLNLGANHYLVKPFKLKNLIELCKKYLKGRNYD